MNKIVIGLLALLLLGSCSMDDYPRNNMSPKPIEKIADAQRYFTGIEGFYREMLYGRRTFSLEIQCDMFNASVDYGNNYGAGHRINESFTPSDYEIEAFWKSCYEVILNANNSIELGKKFVPETPSDMAQFNYYMGAYHFFRASAYHTLARTYANAYSESTAGTDLGVPIVLVPDETEKPPRSTLAELYVQIEGDIKIANDLMGEFMQYVESNGTSGQMSSYLPKAKASHPTLDAVKALKARVKLDMREYDEAARLADELITSGLYRLASDVSELSNEWFKDTGIESIFQVYNSNREDDASFSSTSMRNFISYQEVTKKYKPVFIPTQSALDMYSASDFRRTVWFRNVACKYSTADLNLDVFWKFRGNSSEDGSASDPKMIFQPKVYTLPEMILIKAEALAVLGQDAAGTLNVLQTARGANLTTGSLDNVKKEWNKEMIGEGQRFFSIKRWNEGFTHRPPQVMTVIAGTSAGDAPHFHLIEVAPGDSKFLKFTWAIPSRDISTNPNVVAHQNPGW